jgi:hypothetical protein
VLQIHPSPPPPPTPIHLALDYFASPLYTYTHIYRYLNNQPPYSTTVQDSLLPNLILKGQSAQPFSRVPTDHIRQPPPESPLIYLALVFVQQLPPKRDLTLQSPVITVDIRLQHTLPTQWTNWCHHATTISASPDWPVKGKSNKQPKAITALSNRGFAHVVWSYIVRGHDGHQLYPWRRFLDGRPGRRWIWNDGGDWRNA